MTIYDISQKAGVSIATVSRVLNGSDKVSPKTRKKVLDVIEQYSYTPNAFARGLGLNTSNTIGILCVDSSDVNLAKGIYYLEQFLREKGYDSILCCCGYKHENRMKAIKLLLSKKVDSIILVGSYFVDAQEKDNEYIHEAAKQIPIMILNADFVDERVYCCLCDDYHSLYSATESMIKEGRTRIAYVYNTTSYSGSKKLTGYLDAMKAHDLVPITSFVNKQFETITEVMQTAENLKSLYESDNTINAIIASEDQLALGALKFILRSGLSCPDDISVIGYNNSVMAVCCEPELTTIDNRLELLCKQVVSNVVNVLGGIEVPRKTIFSGQLIRRQTTCNPGTVL